MVPSDLSTGAWGLLATSALFIGMAKTGLPGVGSLAIVLMALVIPARQSTGLILPMLIVGDLFAVSYYSRHAVWSHLWRLLPFALPGIVAGYWGMHHLPERYFAPLIGGTILVMLVLGFWQNRGGGQKAPPGGWLFPAAMGLLGGVTTMMANAAGPILVIYLLAMRLPKTEFIGTGAWFFLMVNLIKVPFSADLGLINPLSLKLNLLLAPLILLGAFLGIRLVRWIPEKVFNLLVQLFAAIAAVKLLF